MVSAHAPWVAAAAVPIGIGAFIGLINLGFNGWARFIARLDARYTVDFERREP